MASAVFAVLFGGFEYQQAVTRAVEFAVLYDGGKSIMRNE